jgi:hypothetical protein
MRIAWSAVLAGAMVLLLFVFVAALSGCDDQDEFSRKCHARGWVVQTHKQGSSTSKRCVPPPQPQPVGWQ